MDRRIRIALVVVILLALAYPAAAWIIGLNVERQTKQREDQILEHYPYFEVVKRDYRRGVYGSTEELTYTLRGAMFRALGNLPGGAQMSKTQIVVRNTIHHGPLPQLRTFAPATVDSEIVLPPDLQQKLTALIGDKAKLAIHTVLGWSGSSTTTVSSSPFQLQLANGATIGSHGYEMTSDVGRDLQSIAGKLDAPQFDYKDATVQAELQGLKGNVAMQRAFEALQLGKTTVTLTRFEATRPGHDDKLAVQNVSLSSESKINGDFVDMSVKLDADSLQAGSFSATSLGYEFRLDHVHGPSLATFQSDFQALERDSADNAQLHAGKLMALFGKDGSEILLQDPVLEMPHIGFKTAQGEMLLSLKVALPGITRADLDGGSDVTRMALLKHLQASADIRIDTDLLDKLLDSSGKGDSVAAPLQKMQRQGYLKLDGKALTTHITFEHGQLMANGLALPTGGPVAAPPPAPGPTPRQVPHQRH